MTPRFWDVTVGLSIRDGYLHAKVWFPIFRKANGALYDQRSNHFAWGLESLANLSSAEEIVRTVANRIEVWLTNENLSFDDQIIGRWEHIVPGVKPQISSTQYVAKEGTFKHPMPKHLIGALG